MSMLRPMRDELFKYRKRKKSSIHSTHGMPYQRYTTPRLGGRPSGFRGGRQKDYLGDTPNQYRPNMFSPAVDWTEYQQDHEQFTHSPKTPPIRHLSDRSLTENPMPVASSDELSMTEQWRMNMGVTPRHHEESVPVEFEDVRHLLEGVSIPFHAIDKPIEANFEPAIPFEDNLQSRLHSQENDESHQLSESLEISKALWFLENRLAADHPDILNLKQAQLQLGRQEFLEMQQNPKFWEIYNSIDDNWQSNLGSGNPYENDDLVEPLAVEPTIEYNDYNDQLLQETQELEQQLFVDEMPDQPIPEETLMPEIMLEEMVEQEFDQLQFKTDGMEMIESEAVFGSPMEIANAAGPEQFIGLEVFDTNSAYDEINQAIDQITEQPIESDPFHPQYDPFMVPEYMVNPKMQFMPDYMMYGFESMDPGFGPIGPIPGQQMM